MGKSSRDGDNKGRGLTLAMLEVSEIASSAVSNEDDLDDEPEDSPRKVATRMNIDQIEDAVNRYRTRTIRMDKLEVLEQDLKSGISHAKLRASELSSKACGLPGKDRAAGEY